MYLYIDIVFIVNFLMNLPALIITAGVSGKTVKGRRTAGAAFWGSLIFCLYFSITYRYGLYYPIIAIILTEPGMLYIMFGRLLLKDYVICSIALMIATCIVGGAAVNIHSLLPSVNNAVVLIVAAIITVTASLRIFATKRYHDKLYDVAIECGERCFNGRGFADTGNLLYDPVFGMPVVIMADNEWFSETYSLCEERRTVVCYNCIDNNRGLLRGIRLSSICIRKGNREYQTDKAVAASADIMNTKEYQFILHADMIGETFYQRKD